MCIQYSINSEKFQKKIQMELMQNIFFSNEAVLQRHGLSGTNKDTVGYFIKKIETYVILCRDNLFE